MPKLAAEMDTLREERDVFMADAAKWRALQAVPHEPREGEWIADYSDGSAVGNPERPPEPRWPSAEDEAAVEQLAVALWSLTYPTQVPLSNALESMRTKRVRQDAVELLAALREGGQS